MAQSGHNDLVRSNHSIHVFTPVVRLLSLLKQINQLGHAAIPIFFSEYGNTSHQLRLFQETTALYSPLMSCLFYGGCVYEFWQSANGYGLVGTHEEKTDTRLVAH
jgi:hypothetical protein